MHDRRGSELPGLRIEREKLIGSGISRGMGEVIVGGQTALNLVSFR
jgi:hypothetical protein